MNEETSIKENSDMIYNQNYQQIIELIEECKAYYKELYDMLINELDNRYHLEESVIDAILQFTTDQIKNLNKADMQIFISGYTKIDYLDEVQEKSEEELKTEMDIIKNSSMMIFSAKTEVEDIQSDMKELMDEYMNYGNVNKISENRKKRIEKYEESLSIIEDEKEKKKTKELIDMLRSSNDFSFLEDRFSKFKEKEIDNIVSSFFNQEKGNYTIKRFMEKIEKFGYNPMIYKFFFNMEENFLPEKYHPFNNLFLFIYMRMVAHSYPDNKKDVLFVQSLTSAMSNLEYHKFPTTEQEKSFISIMEKVLDHFSENEEYREYFTEYNSMAPTNKVRIEQEQKIEREKRENILRNMVRIGMDIESLPEDISVEELQEKFQTHAKELISIQNKEYKEMESISELSKDTDTLYDATVEKGHQAESYLKSVKNFIEKERTEEEYEKEKQKEEAESIGNEDVASQGEARPEACDKSSAESEEASDHAEQWRGENHRDDNPANANDDEDASATEEDSVNELETETAMKIYDIYLAEVSKIKEKFAKKQLSADDAITQMNLSYTKYKEQMAFAGYTVCYSPEEF